MPSIPPVRKFGNPDFIHPMLRELFDIVRMRGWSFRKLAQKAGVSASVFYHWNTNKIGKPYRTMYSPKISSVDVCLQAVGYKLIMVPLEWAEDDLAFHDYEDFRILAKRVAKWETQRRHAA